MNKLFLIFILNGLLSCSHPESKEFKRHKSIENFEGSLTEINGNKIVGIKDGDTYVVLINGKEQIVRLAHIDCPEKKQPFGNKAKQYASSLCFGEFVQLNHNNKYDRNQRLIAEIILKTGVNVNKELVGNGLAWHYKKYSDNQDYADLEILARKNKIGIWSESNPIAPWDWRKK